MDDSKCVERRDFRLRIRSEVGPSKWVARRAGRRGANGHGPILPARRTSSRSSVQELWRSRWWVRRSRRRRSRGRRSRRSTVTTLPGLFAKLWPCWLLLQSGHSRFDDFRCPSSVSPGNWSTTSPRIVLQLSRVSAAPDLRVRQLWAAMVNGLAVVRRRTARLVRNHQ